MDSEPKTNMELDSPDEQSPRLVLIVSDGSLMAGRPEQLAGRSTIHMPIASPELPIPAIATTIATGVDATTHGIVTAATIEPTTLETRLVQASERWFPTFWNSGNAVGIRTALIDWPASIGDPDVSFLTPPPEIDNRMAQGTSVEDAALALLREEFDPMEPLMLHRLQRAHASLLEARDLLASDSPPHVIGIVLRDPLPGEVHSGVTQHLQREIESFLSLLSEDTNVLLVHRRVIDQDDMPKLGYALEATFLIAGCTHEIERATYLKTIGGATYALANIPCPVGVFLPKFSFLPTQNEPASQRTFPTHLTQDDTDWQLIIDNLSAVADSKPEVSRTGLTLIKRRFGILSTVAYSEKQWKRLEQYCVLLFKLRTDPRDYWAHVLALHQQEEFEQLPGAIELLRNEFPDTAIAKIAESLLLIETSPESAKLLLEEIDPTQMTIPTAFGTFGRLAIRAELVENGMRAIKTAIVHAFELPADRAALAQVYFSREEYETAFGAIGKVGSTGGHLSWRLLRLRILVALDRTEDARQLATSILQQHPANPDAMQVLE